MNKKYYTGIGSRKATEHAMNLGRSIGREMAQRGYILRSGAAAGMDTAFEEGAAQEETGDSCYREIYLPWKHFRMDHWVKGASGKVNLHYEDITWALGLLSSTRVCPEVRKMRDSIQLLFARNVCQVLGLPTKLPHITPKSEFVVYWAPINRYGDCMGGTRIAVNLAKHFHIPTYNLLLDEDQHRFNRDVIRVGDTDI